MGRSKKKAFLKEMISADILGCKHCGKCYRTVSRTEKISKGINIAKLKRHKKVCEAKKLGIVLPEDLLCQIVNAYQDATINQHSTNGYMREMGNYNYNTETQTEHKDYDTH